MPKPRYGALGDVRFDQLRLNHRGFTKLGAQPRDVMIQLRLAGGFVLGV